MTNNTWFKWEREAAIHFLFPSIIGTKVATQVLKTGDLVEVDANKGIIRLLN